MVDPLFVSKYSSVEKPSDHYEMSSKALERRMVYRKNETRSKEVKLARQVKNKTILEEALRLNKQFNSSSSKEAKSKLYFPKSIDPRGE